MIAGAALEMQLLGHPEIRREGGRITLPTRKAMLLLARLAVEGAQSRELLSTLLWPDADEDRGRTNLRRTLAYVRDACGRDIEVVAATQGSISLGKAAATDLDIVFRGVDQTSQIADLQRAAAAWRGDFLEGVNATGEEMDDWIRSQRSTWQRRGAAVCQRLLTGLSERGDLAGALTAADRWLARDPISELAHRERIRLHLARGDRTAALEAYRVCAEALDRELGISPSDETKEVAEMARRRERPPASNQRPELEQEVPMLGREDEHAVLAGALHRAASGAPEIVLLLGEPGIGKSRLATEFAAWASTQGAQVLSVRAFPSGRRLAYAALADALGSGLVTPSESGAAAERQLFESAAGYLLEVATRSVLVLIVDDLQWLDPDSLEVLLYAAVRLARSKAPFLLLAIARDDELAASSTLQDWVDRAGRDLRLIDLTLVGLNEIDSRRFVQMWPASIPAGAEQVVAQAAGRPLLLVESLRYLAAGGDPGTIAPAARQALQARLRTLGEAAVRLAAAAAAIEKPATSSVLAKVARLDESAARGALDELLARHVLAGEGQYSYSHELLRRTAYASHSAESRRELHASVVQVLDATPGCSPAEVAHHAEMAGDLELAWQRRVEAGREAMAMPAYRAAADQFRAALAIRPEPGPVWLELGRAEELSGRPDLAAGTYRGLADRARRSDRPDHESEAMVRLAELAGRDLEAPVPEEIFSEAREAARDSGKPDVGVEVELAAAQVHAYRGDLSLARSRVAAVADQVKDLGRPDLTARCLNLGAFISMAQGRWTDTLNLARRAADAYRKLGETLMWIDSTGYEVVALVFLGDWQSGLRRARRGLTAAQRLGNSWQVSNLSMGEAWALRDGGRLEEASQAADRGVAAAEAAGFLPLQILNAAVAGRCRRELGDPAAALEIHGRFLAPARAIGSAAPVVMAEELCADHVRLGDWDAASERAAEAEAGRGENVMFSCLSLWTVAQARLRDGAAFEPRDLPEGDRYGLVRLRTEAVIAQHSGDEVKAGGARHEALAIAKRLALPVEINELEQELELTR